MMQTDELARRRFEVMAAEYLVRMGQKLRERREELDLSRSDLARQMPGKVSENQIYRWEKGAHHPNPDTLEALARLLGRPVSYFMTATAEKKQTPDLLSSGDPQLDRIEQKLDRLLAALTPQQRKRAGLTPLPEGELGRVLEGDPPTEQAPGRTRRHREGGQRRDAA